MNTTLSASCYLKLLGISPHTHTDIERNHVSTLLFVLHVFFGGFGRLDKMSSPSIFSNSQVKQTV